MPLMKFHLATTLTRWLRRWTNFYNAKLLQEIKDAELCPYVEVVPGFDKSTGKLSNFISEYGGVVFASEVRRKFFWHPDEKFIPITATALLQTSEGWKPPPATGSLCQLCKRCEFARPKYPDAG
jgi:hypothetical protein